jgi:serine/threonine protein phosphatase PrpC
MHEFFPRFVILKNEKIKLPFTIGGLTQKGPHFGEDQNNQDAMSIITADETIIAVVCDGCSGGSDTSKNSYSYNEFAAQSLSILAIKHIQEFIFKENDINDNIATFLEEQLIFDLRTILSVFNSNVINMGDYLIQELMLSTIVAVIIFKKKWYVLHGGDGLVIMNGSITELKDDSGQYIANKLHSRYHDKSNILKILYKGQTSDVKHILIATDGVSDFIRKDQESFFSLCSELEQGNKVYSPGYDDGFFREFRKRFSRRWENKDRSDHDDRSFILIRHLPITEDAKINILPDNNISDTKGSCSVKERNNNDKVDA